MAPINEGIGRRHFLRVFGTAAVALAGGVAAFDIKVSWATACPAWMRRMRTTRSQPPHQWPTAPPQEDQ